MQIYKQIWQYWKRYKLIFFMYLLLGVGIYACALIFPYINGQIINDAIGKLQGDILLPKIGVLLICVLVKHTLTYIRTVFMTKYAQFVLIQMRNDIFDKLMHQSLDYLHRQQGGEIMTIYGGDAEVCKQFYQVTVPTLIEQFLCMAVALYMMFYINPWMALSILAFMPLLAFTTRLYAKKMRPLNIAARENLSSINSVVQENIGGMRIVRSFDRGAFEIEKMGKVNGAYRNIMIRHINTNAKYSIYNHISSIIPQIACVIAGSILLLLGDTGGGINIGQYFAFWGYTAYVIGPITSLSTTYINTVQQTVASGTKLFNFLNTGSAVADAPDAIAPDEKTLKDHFKFEHVSLSIDGKVILKDIDLDIPKGKHIAITGTTGSGKTMLINLLSRIIDPTDGAVTLDGTDIRKIPLKLLRRRTSTVSQEAFLFSDTIENNIAFFDPDAPDTAIEKCAAIAQAGEFIAHMQDGYKTVVGERGVGLSGGQRQRLSIARALLKDAPVLILDDSTSALDMDTEQNLLRDLNKNLNDKTLIIIAHRISALKNADEILFMKDGRIIERGTHDELMALGGAYAQTARDQYGAMYGT